jgi:excisionase family DNA binding protein
MWWTRQLFGKGQHSPLADLMTNTISPWLTANEAARYLKVKPCTVVQWAKQGKLKGFSLSGTLRRVWRFQQIDLDAKNERGSRAV